MSTNPSSSHRYSRILFAVGSREIGTTQKRVLTYLQQLSELAQTIEVVTHDVATAESLKDFTKDITNITVIENKPKGIPWSPHQRDDFVKSYISQVNDVELPGTDFKYWKASAFDDFRGHISGFTFSEFEMNYDLIVMPLPSIEDGPSNEGDVFFTTVLFYAKNNNIPVIGIQIHPVMHLPRLMLMLVDTVILKSEEAREFLVNEGFHEDKLKVLVNPVDRYCASMMEDNYKNLMLDNAIPRYDDKVAIVLINHARYRTSIIDIIKAIGAMDTPRALLFSKVKYATRELHEDVIVEDLIKPHLDRVNCECYIVEEGAVPNLIMHADIVISTTFVTPLEFAVHYDRCAVIYNPVIYDKSYFVDQSHLGVKVLDDLRDLRSMVKSIYKKKQKQLNFRQIIEGKVNVAR